MSTDEQEAFERELAQMMSETSIRSTGKAPVKLDVGLPVGKRTGNEDAVVSSNGNSMVFTLVTKKGNKAQVRRSPLCYKIDIGVTVAQTRSVEVPAESAIAVHTRSKQLESKAEQEQMKRLVLDYEARAEEERRRGASALTKRLWRY